MTDIFERIKDFIKGAFEKMFTKQEIKRIVGTDAVITDAMLLKIKEWRDMLSGNAEWINEDVESLRLERGICREFAFTVTGEMESKVSNEALDELYQKAITNLCENFQDGLALGSMIIKPLGGSKVEFVPADRFIPLAFDDEDNLVKVCFIDTKYIADDNIYYRFEKHNFSDGVLTISHKAFHSHSAGALGTVCSLAEVEEWANYPEEISYTVDRPIYGFYKNPLPNDIDRSPCGVSIFECERSSIKKADKQYGRLDWEFESGERAIYADVTAFGTVGGKKALPKLKGRLYKAVDIAAGDGKDLFETFSPEFRDTAIRSGLEEFKRNIEFGVGLAYGDLSTPQLVEKTAAEVITSKQRKYSTVNAIQKKLKTCLEGLVFGLAFMNGLTRSGYEFTCNFEDSILTDDETRRAIDRQDVSMGAMQLWEYRMKWYGEDENTAKKMTESEKAEVIE